MKVIGIDPGLKGYIVELDLDTRTARCMRLPWRYDVRLNSRHIATSFNMMEANIIVIEKVGPDPKWGRSNIWSFARGVGEILQFASHFPYLEVHPKTWQKSAHAGIKLAVTTKEKTLCAFQQRNPDHPFEKLDHNLCDAYFLACHGLGALDKLNNWMFEELP
jgi:hypothetical protein